MGLLAMMLGCYAEPEGAIGVAVQEVRCGRTSCALPNATAMCNRGRCAVASCFTYSADCNHVDADGCEVNVASDVNHCGGCGLRCETRPNTVARCETGTCQYACAPGYADCDGDPANGCEVATASDREHCGACGQRCWGADSCCEGVCVATSWDLNHCGACGNRCVSTPGTEARCEVGRCVSYCGWPTQECDGDPATVCETDITANDAHCGACNNACADGMACREGRCACPTHGQEGCFDPATGTSRCIDVLSDANNCGYCDNRCPAGMSCSYGRCDCAPGQQLCWSPADGPLGPRCVDVASDPAHCGYCNNACPPDTLCSAGRCEPLPFPV